MTTNEDGVITGTTLNGCTYEGARDVDGVITSKSFDINFNELAVGKVAAQEKGVTTRTAINRGGLNGLSLDFEGISTGVSTGEFEP